jgi:catechol 2,3-dioxygenase-like lactoylglutathione lyase family enzyme
MIVSHVDHVQLAAPPACETAAREFFGGVLGLQEIEKPAALQARGGCWFKIGSRQLHVGVDAAFRPATKAHIAFAVRDIDAAHDALVKAGVRCVWDEELSSVRRFYANDPWGNRLEFTEPTSTSAK